MATLDEAGNVIPGTEYGITWPLFGIFDFTRDMWKEREDVEATMAELGIGPDSYGIRTTTSQFFAVEVEQSEFNRTMDMALSRGVKCLILTPHDAEHPVIK